MVQGAFFDQYAEAWDAHERRDMPERVARVVALSNVERGARALDVGTGTGVLIPPLLDAVGANGQVIAIDVSGNMLRVAAHKGFPRSVILLKADAERPCFRAGTFDNVMCNAVYPHFSDRVATLEMLVSLLRSGGGFTISHPIGREAVNKLHRSTGDVIAEDEVPAPDEMLRRMEVAGLRDLRIIDEPEFYYAFGRKT